MLLVGCKSNDVVYVDRIVEVEKPSIPTRPCDIPKRDGDKVIDYIVAESRLHNALVICNMQIEATKK